MLSKLLKNNRETLRKTGSYLLPQLNRIINLIANLEKIAANDNTNALKRQKLPKGTFLLRAGSVCRHIWFLEKGIARVFACKDGEEANLYFFFPSEIIDSFCGSTLKAPSETNVQLMRNSIVYSISKARLEELKSVYPVIAEIERLLLECHANWMEKRIYNIQVLNACERYIHLLKTQPHLIQQISTTHLASYLGISRKTMSRSRRALNE